MVDVQPELAKLQRACESAADRQSNITTLPPTSNHLRMATLIARIAIPKTNGSILSMCARTARLGGVIGTTGLFGAHFFVKPTFAKTQCQGKPILFIIVLR